MKLATILTTLVATVFALDSVTIPLGHTYSFEYPANPTTGFTWNISDDVKAAFAPYFTVTSTYLTQPSDCQDCTGSGGVTHFTITAVAPGTALFTATYNRPWEKNIGPIKTVSIEITVA
jgi:predicted secreted protein